MAQADYPTARHGRRIPWKTKAEATQMGETIDSMEALREKLAQFVAARDWDQFHSPKNLAMALVAEAGELVEHFQWLTEEQSLALPEDVRAEVSLEIADVLMFLVRLADKLGIDPLAAAGKKLSLNERKYPVEKAKGKATKYDKL
jgi:dCTP diphosphatase